jgi:hypothetical protein
MRRATCAVLMWHANRRTQEVNRRLRLEVLALRRAVRAAGGELPPADETLIGVASSALGIPPDDAPAEAAGAGAAAADANADAKAQAEASAQPATAAAADAQPAAVTCVARAAARGRAAACVAALC